MCDHADPPARREELRPPAVLHDLSPAMLAQSISLANEFAKPGTVMHFALRLGYMPSNEEQAEATIKRMLREGEWWEEQARRLNGEK